MTQKKTCYLPFPAAFCRLYWNTSKPSRKPELPPKAGHACETVVKRETADARCISLMATRLCEVRHPGLLSSAMQKKSAADASLAV
jgi:hypothetical protein